MLAFLSPPVILSVGCIFAWFCAQKYNVEIAHRFIISILLHRVKVVFSIFPRIPGYSSRGGENRTETDIKLACKTVFVQFSTSGGRPMLLVRLRRTRRCPPVNSNDSRALVTEDGFINTLPREYIETNPESGRVPDVWLPAVRRPGIRGRVRERGFP